MQQPLGTCLRQQLSAGWGSRCCSSSTRTTHSSSKSVCQASRCVALHVSEQWRTHSLGLCDRRCEWRQPSLMHLNHKLGLSRADIKGLLIILPPPASDSASAAHNSTAFGLCVHPAGAPALPDLQGVEAVLHVLHDCYGYDYPGGLFLAAVDVMLEKATAVQPVQELLQAIAGGAAGKLKYWYSRAALHIAV